jgi:hypothetical protein
MSLYLIRFTPRESYFFGNEKTFGFPGSNVSSKVSHYYISGEDIPAQTSLIGTLRYILLPVKKDFADYSDSDKKTNGDAVGYKSFKYGEENKFGKIKGLSPIFILKGEEKLIVTPYDHQINEKSYTYFPDYKPCSEFSDKVYPPAYNAKDGISHSYMSLLDGKIYSRSDIFKTDTRIGINRGSHDFFKKDYVAMNDGFAFGAYVELEDDLTPPTNTIAYMGQGKSLFTVEFIYQEDAAAKNKFYAAVADKLHSDIVYCLSDVFVTSAIYDKTKFAITELKDYRAYTTPDGKVSKDSSLYRVIKAGSIFIPSNYTELKEMITDENTQIIGYNTIISKKETYL